ncbi:MAG: outer membrane protein transport protein [Myxococcota bacterium]|nr:outer membrane protein transport protein [Myxococcota bacterium]
MRLQKSRITGLAALLALAWSVSTNSTRAAGFLIYETSAESVAKGSAYSAYVDEPSAVWFNPAAMSFMPGYRVQTGAILATGAVKFDPADGSPNVDSESTLLPIPMIFGTSEIVDWLHAGIGVSFPWGMVIAWPEDWVGRESSIKSDLQTVLINPSVSFQIWQNRLSIAGGFNVLRATLDFKYGLPEVTGGTLRFGGSAWGYGVNAGILFRILPNVLHTAFAYRSRINISAGGKADFTVASEEFSQMAYDQGADLDATLPDIFTLGLMYAPTENLILGFDMNYTLWSVFEELRIVLKNGDAQVREKDWKDVATFRLSADYTLPVKGFKIRGGIIYDSNPAPKETLAPDIPDADRLDFSVGAGYRYDWFKADLGYMLCWLMPSEATTGQEGPEGTYEAFIHLIGLTVTFQFGTEDEDDVDPALSSRAGPGPTDYR